LSRAEIGAPDKVAARRRGEARAGREAWDEAELEWERLG
jgi:hypothetical protein